MPSKKIIFVNRFFYPDHSATAQILSDLAFRLASAKHRVVVITTTGLYDAPAADLTREERRDDVDIHRVYRPRFGRGHLVGRGLDYALMYCFFAFAAFRLAAEGDIIVAKTDPPLLSVALLPVALLRRARLVNWLQDLYPEIAVAFGMKAILLLFPILKPLRDVSLKKAHRNVVIGANMQDRLLDVGVCAERISLIENWCADQHIRPLDRDANPLRHAWGLAGKFVIAYSGNLGRAHEVDTLLGAAERLKDVTNLVFVFIGGGKLATRLKKETAQRGLAHLFQFQPYQPVEALSASLTLPDVFWVSLRPEMEGLIVPSKFYGNCAAGRPTIFVGDPRGEIGRIVEESDCGVAVRVGDSKRLAETILTLMQDKARLDHMGRNARRALETRFARARGLAAWEQLIERVIFESNEATSERV
jgi:glycosyltransferase involved in cell wall biosynthesis